MGQSLYSSHSHRHTHLSFPFISQQLRLLAVAFMCVERHRLAAVHTALKNTYRRLTSQLWCRCEMEKAPQIIFVGGLMWFYMYSKLTEDGKGDCPSSCRAAETLLMRWHKLMWTGDVGIYRTGWGGVNTETSKLTFVFCWIDALLFD